MFCGFYIAYAIPVSFLGIYDVHYIIMVPIQSSGVLEKGTPCSLALTPPHAILYAFLFV